MLEPRRLAGILILLILWLAWAPLARAEVRELSLDECIRLALTANTDVSKGRLDRLLARLDKEIGQAYFHPDLYLYPSTDYKTDEEGRLRLKLGSDLVQRLPTGGELRLSWDNSFNRYTGEGDQDWTSGVGVRLSQPLLRGAGLRVGTAAVVLSGLEDEESRWRFERVLTSLITLLQKAYWNLLYATEGLKVAQDSLEVSRRLLEERQAAAKDIDTADLEAEVASGELEVYNRSLAVTKANLRLLDLMDVKGLSGVRPKGGFELRPVALDQERFLRIALERRPDLKIARVAAEIARLRKDLADSNAKTDLDLVVRAATRATEDELAEAAGQAYDLGEEWIVGLAAELRFGVPDRRRDAVAADYRLRKAELDLAERLQSVENDVTTAVESLRRSLKSIELAQRSTRLAERKTEVARQGLERGEVKELKVLIYQRDLTAARLAEYRAMVNYLDDLADLDEAMGTTLETWRVEVGP